jgi:hypothetical protein
MVTPGYVDQVGPDPVTTFFMSLREMAKPPPILDMQLRNGVGSGTSPKANPVRTRNATAAVPRLPRPPEFREPSPASFENFFTHKRS